MSSSSSAGPSRPRVITLTADQLLGTSLTPARPHKQSKNTNAPRVLTIEDLLGPGLTVARPPPKPPAPKPAVRPAPRAHASSTRSAPNPRLVRVTADEVLRTGIPVRTLQAVKVRSGQARVLTAEELLAAGSSRSAAQSRGRAASAAAAGQSSSSGSSRTSGITAGGSTQSTGSQSAGSSRNPRPATATNGSGDAHARAPRSGQARRSNSLGSTRTLPMYTQEPGESEVVIDRGATELEDDDTATVPITVISPVDENASETRTADNSPVDGDPNITAYSPPASPVQLEEPSASRQQSPVGSASPQVLPSSLPSTSHLPPWSALYPDAAPSYEAAMSTPNLHIYPDSPANVPLPSSPVLSPSSPSSPVMTAASPAHAPAPSALAPSSASPSPPPAPASPVPRPTTSTPSPSPRSPASPVSSPGTDGADTPRRRFGFISTRLRSHSHSHSHLPPPNSTSPTPTPTRGHSRTGSASAASSPRVASPDLLAPAGHGTRAFHRLSQSASGSMLDLLAVVPRARSRSRSRADE
ncbi:hypothetical protein C8Q70DRAFT_1046115 [Cubamyces menziesii]|nr:hypothetical protein C8Q70DRAFT_1046115 [Cubamyces menziesii]